MARFYFHFAKGEAGFELVVRKAIFHCLSKSNVKGPSRAGEGNFRNASSVFSASLTWLAEVCASASRRPHFQVVREEIEKRPVDSDCLLPLKGQLAVATPPAGMESEEIILATWGVSAGDLGVSAAGTSAVGIWEGVPRGCAQEKQNRLSGEFCAEHFGH